MEMISLHFGGIKSVNLFNVNFLKYATGVVPLLAFFDIFQYSGSRARLDSVRPGLGWGGHVDEHT